MRCVVVVEFIRWREAEDAERQDRRGRNTAGYATQGRANSATGGFAAQGGAGSTASSGEHKPSTGGCTAKGDAGAAASSGAASTAASGIFAPCSGAPHCPRWESQHGGLPEGKRMEYLFLYAADAHCLHCLQFYSTRVNIQCTSCRKNARAWANQRKGQVMTPELDAWFSSVGL